MVKRQLIVMAPSDRRPRGTPYPGTASELLYDCDTPTDSLYAGIRTLLKPGAKVDLHEHPVEEFQYILYGSGVVRDAHGNEYALTPGTAVYCPSGPEGAHEFENTGNLPLGMLVVFPSPGGVHPD